MNRVAGCSEPKQGRTGNVLISKVLRPAASVLLKSAWILIFEFPIFSRCYPNPAVVAPHIIKPAGKGYFFLRPYSYSPHFTSAVAPLHICAFVRRCDKQNDKIWANVYFVT